MTRADRILAASGGDPDQAALVARMLARKPFHCANCLTDWPEAHCDCCGARLTTATGDRVATQEVRPSTTDGALIPGKESRAVRPKESS